MGVCSQSWRVAASPALLLLALLMLLTRMPAAFGSSASYMHDLIAARRSNALQRWIRQALGLRAANNCGCSCGWQRTRSLSNDGEII